MLDNQPKQNETPSLGKRLVNGAKQGIRNKLNKNLKNKVLKKVAKKAMMVAGKAILAAIKALLAAALSISLPVIGFITLVGIGLILIYMIFTLMFTLSPDTLDEEQAEMREKIMIAAANTVNQDDPFESQFEVPYELIVAALQIIDSEKSKGFDDEDIEKMANTLAPEFFYKELELERQTMVESCVDGSCSTSESTEKFKVKVIEKVITWEEIITYEYEIVEGSWTVTSSESSTVENEDGTTTEYSTTVSVKEQTYNQIANSEVDYTKYEEALKASPFKYSLNDRYTVEVLYALSDNPIYYREWVEGNLGFIDGGFDGNVIPGSSIPSEYFPIYLAAEKKYGVSWYYIAALHYVETKFSTISPMISSVGAEGHLQFMPCSWLGWGYPACAGTNGYADIPDSIKHDPAKIKEYGGYGVDANGNGIASPWEIEDAIFAAASYLAKNGFKNNIDKSILAYNHSTKYLEQVKEAAKKFKEEASYVGSDLSPNTSGFIQPTTGSISSGFGWRTIYGSRDFHQGVDIKNVINTPIYSIAEGKVTEVNNNCPKTGSYGSTCGYGWGNYVKILHTVPGGTYEAVYAHLYAANVGRGDIVSQGQVIGAMGTSGSSTGVHLHFEIHYPKRIKYQNVINPALVVPLP